MQQIHSLIGRWARELYASINFKVLYTHLYLYHYFLVVDYPKLKEVDTFKGSGLDLLSYFTCTWKLTRYRIMRIYRHQISIVPTYFSWVAFLPELENVTITWGVCCRCRIWQRQNTLTVDDFILDSLPNHLFNGSSPIIWVFSQVTRRFAALYIFFCGHKVNTESITTTSNVP